MEPDESPVSRWLALTALAVLGTLLVASQMPLLEETTVHDAGPGAAAAAAALAAADCLAEDPPATAPAAEGAGNDAADTDMRLTSDVASPAPRHSTEP